MMATIERPPLAAVEPRVVFYDVPWETYLSLRKCNGEGRLRLTYDRGTLEIMSPSPLHEQLGLFLHRLIAVLAEELGIEMRSSGAATMHTAAADRGAEADQSYYFRHEAAVRGQRVFDPATPPDLAVEIDISSSSSKRLPVCSTKPKDEG